MSLSVYHFIILCHEIVDDFIVAVGQKLRVTKQGETGPNARWENIVVGAGELGDINDRLSDEAIGGHIAEMGAVGERVNGHFLRKGNARIGNKLMT